MEILKNTEYIPIKSSGLEYYRVAPGVWGMKIVFVNVYIIAAGEDDGNWVLIDAGLKGSGDKIKRMAEDIFGKGTNPSAIILTHGHFDHVGALEELLAIWKNTPVYSHYLELPYLKGVSSYPPPDPMVGGGLMSLMSWTFPKKPKDLGNNVRRLAANGDVPELPEWEFIHTPGHAPGQIALFRERDRTLIAADTFVTTKQESAFSVMTQKHVLSGPPKYFTIDWIAAKTSVQKLLALKPQVAATGHGYPMYGEELISSLTNLVQNFEKEAIPAYGRYVKEPARANKNGVQYIPKRVNNPELIAAIGLIGAVTAFALVWKFARRKQAKDNLSVSELFSRTF